MTPDEHNALATRVETEPPSEELRALILAAIGSEAEPDTAPDPLRCLDDAMGMMPERWLVWMIDQTTDGKTWYCALSRFTDGIDAEGEAPTLHQTWTAAILRARAMDMESET